MLLVELGVGGGRLPGSGLSGAGLLQHLIDLLKGKTLGLGNKEVGIDKATSAEGSPQEEDAGAEVGFVDTDQIRGDDGNNAVPQPVGRSGQSNTTGTDRKREDFTNKNPSTRTPGSGKEEDIDGNESDLSVDGRDVVGDSVTSSIEMGLVEANSDTNDTDNEFTDGHTSGTPDEHSTTTETLDQPEGDGSANDIDEGEDKRHKEGIGNSTSRLKEDSRVIENEVDTSPLLHHLKRSTEDGLADVGRGLEERAGEAVSPRTKVTAAGDNTAFIFSIGDDFVQLRFNVVGGGVLTTDTSQSNTSFVDLALLDKVTGGLRKEEKTSTEDKSPQHLQANWDTIRAGVFKVLSCVGNAGSKQKTDGDAELVTRDDGTTDLLRRDFRHVQNDDSRHETDTETSDETSSNKKTKASRGSLKNDTNDENDTSENNGEATTEEIREVTSNQGSEEGTSRKNGDNKGRFRRLKGSSSRSINHVDKVLHTLDTTDVTRVITEENTTERSKDAHGVCSPGDGSFNTVKVIVRGNHATFTVFLNLAH